MKLSGTAVRGLRAGRATAFVKDSTIKPRLAPWQRRKALRELGAPVETLRALIDAVAEGRFESDPADSRHARGLYAALLGMRRRLRTRRDVSRRERREYERLRAALDCVNAHVMIGDRDNTIVYLNRTAERMFDAAESKIRQDIPGFRARSLLGSNMDVFHRNPKGHRKLLSSLEGEHRAVMTLGGESFQLVVHTVRSQHGELLGSVVEWKNISEQKRRAEEERRHNRQIEQILDVLGNMRFSVDADGLLTDVNRSASSFLGYRREQLIGQPLEEILADGMTVASVNELAAKGVFQNMRGLLKRADGVLAPVDLSGLAILRNGADKRRNDCPEQLLLLAQPAAQRRLALEQALRAALENDEFELLYQPQIELSTGRMVGVEALIRWRHPTRGIVSPVEFIDVAEKIGLIEELGVWVLRTACNQAVEWNRSGLPALCVAVNISGSHFEGGRILAPVETILAETGLDPACLELEVTETVVQTNAESSDTFDRLKRLGVRIAIDDFGTGYSCLDSIRRLPLHRLKIDRVFVHDLLADTDNSSIIATIIAMGRAMGLTVVAEGVEQLEQAQYLRGLGCDLVQGFYFSKPVAAADIAVLADQCFLPQARARNSTVGVDAGIGEPR